MTRDTADLAIALGNGALINRHTSNAVRCVKGYKLDYMLGAGSDTLSASDTELVIHLGDTVYYLERAERAHLGTGTETNTSVGAKLVAAAKLGRGNTVVCAVVYVFFLCSAAAARAHYLCAHTHGGFAFASHNTCDLVDTFAVCDNAGVKLCFALYYRFRECRTASISASAAVSTRQYVAYLWDTLVNHNVKRLGGDRQ